MSDLNHSPISKITHHPKILTMNKLFTSVLWLFFVTLSSNMYGNVAWALFCPNDTTVSCSSDITNLSKFGNATYHDHNGYHSAGTPVVKKYLDGCGGGYITRTWTVEDPNWNIERCTQTIYVGLPGGLFKESNIKWPKKEVFLTGCNPDTDPLITGKPTYDQVGCSMIAVGKTDNLYEVNASCKKLIRRWKVMDWCQANGSGAWSNDGIWYFDQYIMIINNDIPDVDCPSDTTIVVEDCNYGEVVLPDLVVDPSSCGGKYTITNSSQYSRAKGANASGRYPVGKTKVVYTIQYGCGSKKYCEFYITVKGGKTPTPICVAEIAIGLMGRDTNSDSRNDVGMVQIWAKDLNLKSEPGCGGNTLNFSFSPDSIVMFKTYTCADLGPNPTKMYVSDKTGNQSYCLVNVIVQNNKANIVNCVRDAGPGDGEEEEEEEEEEDNDSTSIENITLAGIVTDAYGQFLPSVKLGIIAENILTKIYSYDTTTVEKRDSFVNGSGITIHFNYTDTVVSSTVDSVYTTGEWVSKITNTVGQFSFDKTLLKGGTYILKPEASSVPLLDIEDLKILVDYAFGYKTIATEADLYRADLNDDGNVDMEDVDLFITYLREGTGDFLANKTYYFNNATLGQTLEYTAISGDKKTEKIKVLFKGDLSNVVATKAKSLDQNIQGVLSNNVKQYEVFPNPTGGMLNIGFTGNLSQKVRFTLYDQTGKLVLAENWQASKGDQVFTTNISTLTSGIYLYQIQSEESIHSGKLIKE